ncbi:MAG: ArsR family transcriptional regulator [Microbacteriaceae bacterium]|nr:ArsR family transcriptional regulator [Microbacteriaceae bacterium]
MAWTFLSNHGHVLVQIANNPEIKVKEIASAVGITERSAQGIISDLVAGGFVTARKFGRRNTYSISVDAHLKHPAESRLTLAEFLAAFSR